MAVRVADGVKVAVAVAAAVLDGVAVGAGVCLAVAEGVAVGALPRWVAVALGDAAGQAVALITVGVTVVVPVTTIDWEPSAPAGAARGPARLDWLIARTLYGEVSGNTAVELIDVTSAFTADAGSISALATGTVTTGSSKFKTSDRTVTIQRTGWIRPHHGFIATSIVEKTRGVTTH